MQATVAVPLERRGRAGGRAAAASRGRASISGVDQRP